MLILNADFIVCNSLVSNNCYKLLLIYSVLFGQVGKTTLGGLLALGYQVAVSFKRESAIYDNGKVSISVETIDDVNKSFIQVKGTDRKVHIFGRVDSLVQVVLKFRRVLYSFDAYTKGADSRFKDRSY